MYTKFRNVVTMVSKPFAFLFSTFLMVGILVFLPILSLILVLASETAEEFKENVRTLLKIPYQLK